MQEPIGSDRIAPGAATPGVHVTLSTASVFPRRVPYAFEAAAEAGYDGVEVMIWSEEATRNALTLARYAAETGMPVRSLHAPTLLVSQRVWGRAPGPKLDRTVEMAQELGASTVVVHPPFRWQFKYARQFEEQVAILTEATGVTIAVENMYPWRGGGREMQAYLPGWDPADHGYDAVTLDLSHASVAQQGGLELLEIFGDRLRHLHLADGTSSARDEHLVPGRGTMDCDKVLAELTRRGWQGDVCLEISTRGRSATERTADLAEALAYARAHLGTGAGVSVPRVPAGGS
ncbi:sugar phosphate isomerase/epimerase family protein [Myceligenerans xiligouense]|uniref:Sugar phosphate isomerase/epimerase n=1 Tax=Myceligenerans xiligouense TaxID=253184 RepID=A0A3N4YME2_9MICO|nr:sugar phosphate isomerase/epimerase family protein [Myceligenerans xiligouense]RPF19600.1 sugar phosphate isomerase/epimerase [Myceligenerans xiligouense]